MKDFRIGEFDRDLVVKPLRAFCPTQSALRLEDIHLSGLHERGKKLILLDVDNTITHWRSEEISAAAKAWIDHAKSLGFKLCIISNTNHPERLQRLAASLDILALRGRSKPSRKMFFEALARFEVTPKEAIMIGDQLLTDVLGANRSGIEAIWLQPLGSKEFFGTKFSRWIERRLVGNIYNTMIVPVDAKGESPRIEKGKPFFQRTIVRQLVKFGIVGGTSFIIDAGLSIFFMTISYGGERLSHRLGTTLLASFPPVHWWADEPAKAAAPVLYGVASLIAMFNSFVWNRRWTFEVRGREERLAQLRRFYTISILGAIFNVAISSSLFNVIPGHPSRSTAIAKAVAAVVVAFWNFFGARLYAFRVRQRS